MSKTKLDERWSSQDGGRNRVGRMPRGRGLIIALVATIGVGASPACTDEGDARTNGSVLSSAAGGPGTPLGNGIELVEGTALIGDPIQTRRRRKPGNDQDMAAIGWKATSLIDGASPEAVFDDYLAQARGLGLTDQDRRGCVLDGDVTICSAEAEAPAGKPRSISIIVLRGRRGDVLSDHVVVQFSTGGLRTSPSKDEPYGDAPVPAAPAPNDWPPLASTGEPIGTASELEHALVVEAGSRLAGQPHLTLYDATGGIEAILEVTGPPLDVLRAYVEQLGTKTLDTHQVGEPVRIDGVTHTEGIASVSGGDYYQFTLIERGGRPTLLHVLGAHD